MDGGINAYHGLVATGGPEAGMAWFPDGATTPELTALAWLLEDGTEKFYRSACESICKEPEHRKLMDTLVAAEDAHKKRLLDICTAMMGRGPMPDFPAGVMDLPQEDVMEGGVKVKDALNWAMGREMPDVIELMMALEANALDLYIRMARRLKGRGEDGAGVFASLADEEREHLERLAGVLERLSRG